MVKMIDKQDKKGWIKLLEAFIAVLLIIGVLYLVIDQGYLEKEDLSSQIYTQENLILKKIQLDDDLRKDVLDSTPLVLWEDGAFPSSVKTKITEQTPNNLNCIAQICEINDPCIFEESDEGIGKDIYSQSAGIFANLDEYDPKQLKLFCWLK